MSLCFLGFGGTKRRWIVSKMKRGGGGGISHLKVMEVIIRNFETTPRRYQNSVLLAWSEQFFSP